MPYAAFGYGLDLSRYERLRERYGIPVVVDAAASPGSTDGAGQTFGSGFRQPVVSSMNATKPFATLEGGLIYCADPATLARLRAMATTGAGSGSGRSIGVRPFGRSATLYREGPRLPAGFTGFVP